jgi:hypothetical protein
MGFRISGLDPAPFAPLFGLPDNVLRQRGVRRMTADCKPGFPDRITLRDAEPGENLLLLNYVHQPANTAYRASHAIFVLEGAREAFRAENEVPEVMRVRPISLRAFDEAHAMCGAVLVPGAELEGAIGALLDDPAVAYIQAHYAVRGCYAALIERE